MPKIQDLLQKTSLERSEFLHVFVHERNAFFGSCSPAKELRWNETLSAVHHIPCEWTLERLNQQLAQRWKIRIVASDSKIRSTHLPVKSLSNVGVAGALLEEQ